MFSLHINKIKNTGMADAKIFSLPVIVAAFGYFVDLYDLLLYSAVRTPSLKDLGVSEDQIFSLGMHILNMQMAGLVLGGIIFGVLGDKLGRTRLMFASILTYSLATLACAFITDVQYYAPLRFIAAVGLSGEVGLAVAFVSEIVPKEKRGYGTALIAGFGVSGAIVAGILGQLLPWRICYVIGALIGFTLLFFRARVIEPFVFFDQREEARKGSLRLFFQCPKRYTRYILCVLASMPITYVLWLMAGFAPELTKLLGLSTPLTSASAIMCAYIGLALGNLASGSFSEYIKSRRKAIISFASLTLFGCLFLLTGQHADNKILFYMMYIVMGLGSGYWIIICTTSAEMFGTNLRATVASSVPNFCRATFIPMGFLISILKPHIGILNAACITGIVVFVIAFAAIFLLPETHGKDLRFEEK